MPVQNLLTELMGTFPRLPYLHAIQLLNRAWFRYQDCRLWSFNLVSDAQLFAPTTITAGSVSATYQSTSVIADATAAAALNAVVAGATAPPLSSPTLGIGRQIRIGTTNSIVNTANGPDYNIVAWDGVNTLTIDKPFGQPTQSNQQYFVYKIYYAAPSLPFTTVNAADGSMIRFMALVNRNSGYTIRGRKLWYTQDNLSAIDPTHSATGDAYIVASYGRNQVGQPVFELYPHPVTLTTYAAYMWTRWPSVSVTQQFPQMPYALETCVMDAARKFACQWALANTGTFRELANVNWIAAGAGYESDYRAGLIQCIKQDDEISPQVPFFQSGRFDFPLGGQFLQNHDLSSLLP